MKKNSIESYKKRNHFFDNISKILGLALAFISIILSIIFYLNESNPNLEFNIITNTSLIDIKENIAKLKITYDSINFTKEKKNISITIFEIKNSGSKSISTNDYDLNIPFGIKLTNAEFIKSPVLIQTSDDKYFNDIIINSTSNQILIKKKIIILEKKQIICFI